MGLGEEIASRSLSIYAQWMGLLSAILLILFGAVFILSDTLFRVLALIIGALCLLMEVTFLSNLVFKNKLSSDDSALVRYRSWVRFLIYLVFAAIMWTAVSRGSASLVFGSIALTFATLFYLLSAVFKQEPLTSRMLGGTGV